MSNIFSIFVPMSSKDEIKDKIQKLQVTHMPVNHWEDKKYKPYTVKMVDLDKVLKIIDELENQ